MSVTVGDIERAVASRFPKERAASWDRVGLLAGDPDREVTSVALALDVTISALAEAAEKGANVLVTHHPAYLEPLSALKPGPGPAGVVFAAVDAGIALINAHTNLDRDAEAQDLMPAALGLTALGPLETESMPMTLVTVYVPEQASDDVQQAMARAGAGRIGDYTGCSFSSVGIGAFTPSDTAHPVIGTAGQPSMANELRVEMVCPRNLASRVVAAAAAAHPYEEPLVTATEVTIARNASAYGMLCESPTSEPLSLRALAALASSTYSVTPRVWGDPDALLGRIVTATGSAGSLIEAAIAAGATALVAGEVRYHDALEAVESGLAVVELGHDVTEWPLVALLERAVSSVQGIDPETVFSLPAQAGWWTT